jgi:class 3 adenylate cyclase/DNA-binding winged helix-turn-helix (wHTH) protein/tetratricopeptide (TPR) repeat protein
MIYAFDDYELDTRLYELRRGGRPRKLEPQVFNVLAYLIEQRDRVVMKAELLEHLWPGQFVSEATLTSRLMAARKAIGDSGQAQRLIQTLHGRGYRFVARVEERISVSVGGAAPESPVVPTPPVVAEPSQDTPTTPSAGEARHCAACQHVNGAEAMFCAACGARLVQGCPHCGRMIRPPASFCPACGQRLTEVRQGGSVSSPIVTSPMPQTAMISTLQTILEGERKQVTVLSCALANATALAEQLGPEAMHLLLNHFFELALREVRRYEGTINQRLGDGFMALFGAPTAHEDHSRRAVRAAVGIQRQLQETPVAVDQRMGPEVAVRIGVHTGVVVIGAISDEGRVDYTAVGDATSVAVQLQQAAAGGQIVISEATYRLVADYCRVQPCGEPPSLGKTEQVQAWEVVSIRDDLTRLEVGAKRGLAPFIGRDRELQLLSDCFDRARSGHGQIAFIVGEPGIGKSRLLHEFRQQLGAADATWHEGHAMSLGQATAFYPLIDWLKRTFQIEEKDADSVIGEKMLQSVLSIDAALQPILPYLRYLLSLDPGDARVRAMDPRQRRVEIFEALQRLLLRAAEVRPQIVVFEDLHWMDQATEEFLAFVADSVATGCVLLILTYRPGYVHQLRERTYHMRIALDTLSIEYSTAMTRTMLAAAGLPEDLQPLIVRKAEGNPFFIEEVVKSLQETGALPLVRDRAMPANPVDEIVVPDTIQDVLTARIDRLQEGPKRVLQLAAVIGREFTRRLLDRLTDTPAHVEAYLQELKALELIHEKRVLPELAYEFKHALTQEVAYNSLLARRRREVHRFIGQAMEELYVDRLAERYEVLAYHFATGEDWSKALAYLLKAGEKAAQAFATREAVALYDQALEGVSQLGEAVDLQTVMAIHHAKSQLYFVLSDFEGSRAEAECLLALARQARDRTREGAALAAIAWALTWARDLDRAITYARQAIEVAGPIDAKPILARSHFTIGFVRAVTGGLEHAGEEIDRALLISRSAGDVMHQSLSLSVAGLLKNWAGEYTTAAHLQVEGLSIARQHNLLEPLLLSFFLYGLTLTGKGDYDQAHALFQEGLTLAEKVGNEAIYHRLLNCSGWLHMELGNLDRAIELNQRSAEVGRRRSDPGTRPNAELNLGEIFLAKGDLALAWEFFDGVQRFSQDPATSDWMRFRYLIRLYAGLGELWWNRGDSSRAQEFANQCLDLATRSGSHKNLVKAWRLQGEIALLNRHWDKAQEWLRQALTIAQALGNPTQLWKTHLALGRLHTQAKRPEMAQRAFRAARQVIDRIEANLQHPELRGSLEGAPLIQQVYDLSTSD